jgi:hypothetical protein
MSKTRRFLHESKPRLDLDRLIEASIERVKNMTPVEKKTMLKAQQRSWVVGEMMLEHPEMSREQVEKIYEEIL